MELDRGRMTAQPLEHLQVEEHRAEVSQHIGDVRRKLARKLTVYSAGCGLAGLVLMGVWLTRPLPSHAGAASTMLAFSVPALPGTRYPGLRPASPSAVETARPGAAALLEPPQAQDNAVKRSGDLTMLGLFGNTEESRQKRADLSLRDAPPGSRVVTFRKPNAATDGLLLGLKFREGIGKSVYIDKILPNTEAAIKKQKGEITEGDEIVMVSATFGDEMWSSRGVGKYRLEKSIAVRQGMVIKFVVEGKKDAARLKKLEEQQKKQAALQTRLQKELQKEVDDEKSKGGLFGGWR